jgi:site-specific DNA-cytosine methylase
MSIVTSSLIAVQALVKELDRLNYDITECLLSPLQFGVPNHRLRYYLCAHKRRDINPSQDYIEKATIHEKWPFDGDNVELATPPISQFLDLDESAIDQHLVPAKYITKSHNFRFGKFTFLSHAFFDCSILKISYRRYHFTFALPDFMFHQGKSTSAFTNIPHIF